MLLPGVGPVDLVLVPDLEARNVVAKQLRSLGGEDRVGIVPGTRGAHRIDQLCRRAPRRPRSCRS
jgi:hypothetical protein